MFSKFFVKIFNCKSSIVIFGSKPRDISTDIKEGRKAPYRIDRNGTPIGWAPASSLRVKTGKIITVTGSAGGREHEKRKDMGRIVLDNSDYCIFTMDDPRDEDVNNIIDELVSDTNKTNYERIINREEAIKKALDMAKDNDIILIAGKGDDNYMAIGNEYLPYSDREVINKYFGIN